MRVNIYAEELTDRVEIIEKEIEGHKYTAVRFYMELPVTRTETYVEYGVNKSSTRQISGPFIHRPGDDDSAAVTFWGKRDLKKLLQKAIQKLEEAGY